MDKYVAATVNVDTDGVVINPDFDIHDWSVYSPSGAFTVEVFTDSYGDAIPGFSGISLSAQIDCQRLRIKSATGTIAVSYYVKGQ